MRSRLLAGIVIAAGLSFAAPAIAAPCTASDPMEIYSGGNPCNKRPGYSKVARTTVSFTGNYKPGSIVINTTERRLYYVLEGGEAIRYGIGVGRAGYTWAGTKTVTEKKEWPDWIPPAQMLARRPDLPRHMKGGEDNPLGARAMYLGSTLYRIHGSNEPDTIGEAVSSGCFRMTNDDVKHLYEKVQVGTTVYILR